MWTCRILYNKDGLTLTLLLTFSQRNLEIVFPESAVLKLHNTLLVFSVVTEKYFMQEKKKICVFIPFNFKCSLKPLTDIFRSCIFAPSCGMIQMQLSTETLDPAEFIFVIFC